MLCMHQAMIEDWKLEIILIAILKNKYSAQREVHCQQWKCSEAMLFFSTELKLLGNLFDNFKF